MGNKHYRGKEVRIFSDGPSELSCILSGNDAITILEFIHRSLSCNAQDDFISLFSKIQELFSFDFGCGMLGYHTMITKMSSWLMLSISAFLKNGSSNI